VVNEIRNLAAAYTKVIVFVNSDEGTVTLPANVQIRKMTYDTYSTGTILRSHFFLFMRLITKEFFAYPAYLLKVKQFKQTISGLLRSFYLADCIKKEKVEGVFYTFWFNQWASALALLKKKGAIRSFVSRVHGADLYEERVPMIKRIPFRRFQLKQVSGVFSVSETGAAYLRKKYPAFAEKIHTSYLGTQDMGAGTFDPQAVFTIVSCAHIRNIKRIYLIPEILKHADFPVRWIHIGEEKPKDNTYHLFKANMKKLEENKLVKVELKGNLVQEEVFGLYKSTPVHAFLSVSSTEGLPVSMMEAISFGIPVMATDVGGCKEIVTEKTGVLIDADPDPEKVMEELKKFSTSKYVTETFRSGVRAFWQQEFNAPVNFANFTNELEAI
jgi:glycosyltransferase involved in cell wall biosynthesis